MIHVRQARNQGDVVLELSGALDIRGAEALVSIALQQPVALRLVIDMTHASSIYDSALGYLVDELPRFRPHSFRGLSQHHSRLLRYLGENIERRGDEYPHTN